MLNVPFYYCLIPPEFPSTPTGSPNLYLIEFRLSEAREKTKEKFLKSLVTSVIDLVKTKDSAAALALVKKFRTACVVFGFSGKDIATIRHVRQLLLLLLLLL